MSVDAQIALQDAERTSGLAPDDPARVWPLFVGPAHKDWLRRPERERKHTAAALEHAAVVHSGGYKHPREMRVSPSSVGDVCTRRVLFSYGGHPQAVEEPRKIDLMDLGSVLHLKWQMEGLSAGWLATPEVWGAVDVEQLTAAAAALEVADTSRPVVTVAKMGGSADGELTDGSLFELKTVGAWKFGKVRKRADPSHLLQMEAYWLIREILGNTNGVWQLGSLVYVNRESGEYKEWRIHTSASRRLALFRWLEEYDGYIAVDELPDMHPTCSEELRVGKVDGMYGGCRYRATCPAAERVTT